MTRHPLATYQMIRRMHGQSAAESFRGALGAYDVDLLQRQLDEAADMPLPSEGEMQTVCAVPWRICWWCKREFYDPTRWYAAPVVGMWCSDTCVAAHQVGIADETGQLIENVRAAFAPMFAGLVDIADAFMEALVKWGNTWRPVRVHGDGTVDGIPPRPSALQVDWRQFSNRVERTGGWSLDKLIRWQYPAVDQRSDSDRIYEPWHSRMPRRQWWTDITRPKRIRAGDWWARSERARNASILAALDS